MINALFVQYKRPITPAKRFVENGRVVAVYVDRYTDIGSVEVEAGGGGPFV